MGALEMLIVLALLLTAPFIALQAYLLVWILGPAIRRAGKCWEEGRQRVFKRHTENYQRAYELWLRTGTWVAATEEASRAAVPKPSAPSAMPDPPEYSITGRRVR